MSGSFKSIRFPSAATALNYLSKPRLTVPNPNLVATEPKSLLQKPVTLDGKKIFAALAKSALHGVTGKWEELAADTVEALDSLGLSSDPGELAFLLVKRSITRALLDIVSESVNQLLIDESVSEEELIGRMDFSMLSQDFYLSAEFLDRPSDISLISSVKEVLGDWLFRHGASKLASTTIASRFPSYFVYALNSEWRRGQKAYASILSAIQTPFARASEREWAWEAYAALLRKRVQESVFDEPFSLSQIYVPLRASYPEDTRPRKAAAEIDPSMRKKRKVVIDLERELRAWLKNAERDDSIRVISGGPGSGKSSFLRIFAAKLSEEGRRVLLIPMHLIDPARDLIDEIGRFVKDEGILFENPLNPDSPEPNLLVVFDGLDEMASQGKVAAETARTFVNEIERTVERRNSRTASLRVVISGRELIIQENESEFRKARQILTLLPYYIERRENSPGLNDEYNDREELLNEDMRQAWWKRYGELSGSSYNGLPKELSRSDLDEVTSQPLLNYLVALSFTRKELDFAKNISLNAIYEDLVGAVYERAYDKKRTYAPIKHMKFEDFFRVLEEIGLAAWHGDGRTTTVREIEEHCNMSGVGGLISTFQEGARAGVTRLLAAFFFRKYGNREAGDPTFVFTHKSFGEYLAARRIARCIERVTRELSAREADPDAGWAEKDALRHWAQICGPSPMSTYLHQFLTGEMQIRGIEKNKSCQSKLESLFEHVLRSGMPMESLQFRTFRDAAFQARNAEEALLVAMNACARVTERPSSFKHPDQTAFGAWLRRIQGQRIGPEPSLAAKCLSFLDLSKAFLHISDLYGADLRNSLLQGVEAMYVNLGDADLSGSDCSGATFAYGCLEHAILRGAKLTEASLSNTDFSYADLRKANLEGANLEGRSPASRENVINVTLRYADTRGIVADDRILRWLGKAPKKNKANGKLTGGRRARKRRPTGSPGAP
jgi:uncharacterized protein YjbI with pentapeptide repeats